jgi:hypothetical protein
MSRVKVTYPTLSRSELVERLKQGSTNLRKALPVTRIILFGSYALNRFTAASDIDLLVVYEDPQRQDAYRIIADQLRLPRLEPRVYTESQYRALLEGKRKFARTLAAEGITILGEGKDGWLREAKTG